MDKLRCELFSLKNQSFAIIFIFSFFYLYSSMCFQIFYKYQLVFEKKNCIDNNENNAHHRTMFEGEFAGLEALEVPTSILAIVAHTNHSNQTHSSYSIEMARSFEELAISRI